MHAIALQDELHWEARLAQIGYDAAMSSELKGGLQTSNVASSLKLRLTVDLIAAFAAYRQAVLDRKAGAPDGAVMLPYVALEPKEAAFLTVQTILSLTKSGQGLKDTLPGVSHTFLATAVAQAFYTQMAFIRLCTQAKAEDAEYKAAAKSKREPEYGPDALDGRIKIALKYAERSKQAKWKLEKVLRPLAKALKPSRRELLICGSEAINLVVQRFPKFFRLETVRTGVKTEMRFQHTDIFWQTVATMRDDHASLQPYLLPTLVPPKDWHRTYDGEPTQGGYFLLDQPLVKHGRWKHTAEEVSRISDASLSALGHVQNTPWMVNTFVGDVALRAVVDDNSLNGLLPLLTQKQSLAGLSGSVAREAREANESLIGKHGEMRRQLNAVITLRERGRFWFPHNFDWRLRMYPLPFDLTPQGNDLSRALLMFSEGVPLTRSGIYWVAAYIAALAGYDKIPFDERVDWTHANQDAICKAGTDPFADLWWTELDEPWQFLSAAHEWYLLSQEENPEGFLSHLPVQFDGSCNGLQHFSMIARDPKGALATNCRPSNMIHDAYAEVAERVAEQVKIDSPSNHIAGLWLTKFTNPAERRKVVKRAVMTTPYGVTQRGITQFMLDDKHVSDFPRDDQWKAAMYMTGLIGGAIDETMEKGREVQGYFNDVAYALAQRQSPLIWETPAGSVVMQKYTYMTRTEVRTAVGKLSIQTQPDDAAIDPKKTAQSASPNVVHSCDGAHLQLTVNAMHEAGIRSYSMIHDSYGTHAANASVMRDVLREQAYEMYKDNYLARWRESVMRLTGEDVPPPPALGDWDLSEVLRAEYMFA